MAGLAGLLGNPLLEQVLLYNVVGQLIGAALTPYTTALTNELNQATPLVPLSPADAADAVIRNVLDQAAAASEASFSGINGSRFATLVALAGNAPDPTSLAVALRRGLIDAGTYDRGIRQGRLRDEWAGLVQHLAVQQPGPEAMLAALLEGQLPEGEARDRYAKLGGDPDYFTILFNTQGQAPTPVEALTMANRGIIPWGGSGAGAVSFEQAFLEGPWRNKWLGAFRQLGEYLPPPRTVSAMHREGALSDAEATSLLEKEGLTPQLAAAYLVSSSRTKVAKHRELAETTVLALYRDRLIPRPEAESFLEALTYTPPEAAFILEVEDLRLSSRALAAGVARVHALYTGHKIDQAGAEGALAAFHVEAAQAAELVAIWSQERAVNVRTLTPAEVAAAMEHSIIDQATAQAELESLGYSPRDAWLYLSIHHKSALPGGPPGGALPAGAGP